jgi:hypothetical protein
MLDGTPAGHSRTSQTSHRPVQRISRRRAVRLRVQASNRDRPSAEPHPYGNNRFSIAARDDGVNPASVEAVNVVNIFAALILNPTERIVFGMTPLEKRASRTRYEFQPDNSWHGKLNDDVRVLFYEGELDGVFPILDWTGMRPTDLGFSVGRQPVLDHDGFLISDTVDSVMLTRSTIPFPGSSFARLSALYGWNKVNKGADNAEDTQSKLYAILGAADIGHARVDLGGVYVASDHEAGDQYNVALSVERGSILFGRYFDTTFRAATSWTPRNRNRPTRGRCSTRRFHSPAGTDNVAYVNMFGAIDEYAPAARNEGTGGPLGRVGLLFSADQLASGPSPSTTARNERSVGPSATRCSSTTFAAT